MSLRANANDADFDCIDSDGVAALIVGRAGALSDMDPGFPLFHFFTFSRFYEAWRIPPLLSASFGLLGNLNIQGIAGQRVALNGVGVGALIDLDDDVLILPMR